MNLNLSIHCKKASQTPLLEKSVVEPNVLEVGNKEVGYISDKLYGDDISLFFYALLIFFHPFSTHQVPDEVHTLPLVEAVEVVSGRDV